MQVIWSRMAASTPHIPRSIIHSPVSTKPLLPILCHGQSRKSKIKHSCVSKSVRTSPVNSLTPSAFKILMKLLHPSATSYRIQSSAWIFARFCDGSICKPSLTSTMQDLYRNYLEYSQEQRIDQPTWLSRHIWLCHCRLFCWSSR